MKKISDETFFWSIKLVCIGALAILALGFAFSVHAATPVAVWDGDFTTTTKGGWTFSANGNTVATDGSSVTIGNTYVSFSTTTAFSSVDTTVILKYADYANKTDSYQTLITLSGVNSTSTAEYTDGLIGLAATKNGGLTGMWKGVVYTWKGDVETYKLPASGHVAMCRNGSGVKGYVNGQLDNDQSAIVASSFMVNRVNVGASQYQQSTGVRPVVATGLKVVGIAIFNGSLSQTEIANYKFPFSEALIPTTSFGFDNGQLASKILGGSAQTGMQEWTSHGTPVYTKVRDSETNYALGIKNGENDKVAPYNENMSSLSGDADWSAHVSMKLADVNNGVLFGFSGAGVYESKAPYIGVEYVSPNKVRVVKGTGKGNKSELIAPVTVPTATTAYHSYLLTFNASASNGRYTLYVDGVKKGDSGSTAKFTGFTHAWSVGNYYGGAAEVGSAVFAGAQVDDFAFWVGTCLDASQAAAVAAKFTMWPNIFTATVSGNTSWSNISWTAPDGSTPVTTANLPESGEIQVTVSSGATLTITAADVTALTAKKIPLKASKITNNGTINFEGGTSSAPIAYTADGTANANEDLGTWTLASDTYVKVTADGNKIYKVTGQGASSCLALTKSGGGIGLSTNSNLNDLTLVSEMPEGQKLWIERGIGNNIRLTANGAVHLSENYKPTFVALNGAGAITRQNSTETLTISCAETANYSGTCNIPLTIGGTALQIISSGSKFTGALTVNSGATVGLKSASPASLSASGAHLIVGANTETAAIQVSTSQGVNLEGATIDIDTFGESAISEEKATYKLISANGGFSTTTMILGDSLTKGDWAVTVDGNVLQAQKKNESVRITIDPTTGTATHDTTSRAALDIDRTWINEKCGTTSESTPEQVTAALNETAANGTKPWESYVLGLDPNVETSIPVIQPAQAASSNGAIAFQLTNVAVNTKAGADVTYKVVTLSAPGGSEIESSASAAPGETISVALPTSGVKYYKLQVDITNQ